MNNKPKRMEVVVQIDLRVPAGEKHLAAMRDAAESLSGHCGPIRASVDPDNPKTVLAEFTMPRARKIDVVDNISRRFAEFMQDYNDQTIRFPSKSRERSRRKRKPSLPRDSSMVAGGRQSRGFDKTSAEERETMNEVTRYEPMRAPDPEAWLSTDEGERIQLAEEYHRRARVKLPNLKIHAVIHVVVESQVAMGEELPVRRTFERLQTEGLDRHEAIHAVGSVLAAHMFDLMETKDPPSDDPNKAYWAELEQLTAEIWRNNG